jgi:hypothetical protein
MLNARITALLCITTLVTLSGGCEVSAQTPMSPEQVLEGVDQRIDDVFMAEAGKPLQRGKKHPPLSTGRGPYVRGYSFSIMAYAARCLYLNEQLDAANAALSENAQYYLDNPLAIVDRDSFHWHADVVMRLIEQYGSNGSVQSGRITSETEAKLLEPIWIYVSKCSWPKSYEYEKSKTWNLHSSENHHAMHFTVCWHFSKLAKDNPIYKDRTYVHGGTPADHYQGWSEYFVEYCKERARRGFGVEMMSAGYNATMMKALYNFYDFGELEVKRAASLLLDLYFAYWAQEQIDGVQGGGKSRVYFGKGLSGNRSTSILNWLYFNIGSLPKLSGHDINPLLSHYRPPAVVVDIARDVQGRGRYEVWQRTQGLGKQGHTFPLMDAHENHLNQLSTDGGGILRYTFCDPAFIMGTPMVQARPLSDWVGISSQNRWQGVIFAGKENARIVPVVRPKDNWRAKNAQWSVQHKGTLITQKLKSHRGGGPMVVWFSKQGLSSKPLEENDIVFLEAERAYAAIRVAQGGYDWHDGPFIAKAQTGDRKTRDGLAIIPKNEFDPVIVEVMAKADIDSFKSFQQRVKACELTFKGKVLHYTGIYGDTLTLDTSFKKTQTINGQPVDYQPRYVYKSPFMNADYEEGIITLTKGDRKTVLDFNTLTRK